MLLTPFAAGQLVTATLLNIAFKWDRTVYQTSDQSVSSATTGTTLVNSTSLTLPVEANSAYAYRVMLFYDTNATADFKYNISLPSGFFIRNASEDAPLGVAAVDTTVGMDVVDASQFSAGGVTAGTMMKLKAEGILSIAATAGNCVVQFAQNTANATATVLKIGSQLQLTKVL